ncbi:MAG: TIM-barrel domain-containing protein [Bacteroidota bacterium]
MIVKETTRIENPATGMTSVGQVVSYHIGTHQLDVYTEKETIRLTQYEDGIFRVQLSRNETFDSFHYAIEPSLTLQPIQVTENDPDRLVLHTDQLEVILMKNPFRVIVKDVKGQILNEDDEAFGTSWIGEQVTTYKRLQPDEKFVGLGEKTGPLNKRGRGYQNWNTDHFGYGTETDPIYCSIPFYMGIHQGGAYGIFFNNSYKSHFNFGASNRRFSSFSADAGDMDYFFIHYKSVTEIIQAYSRVTGKLPLPPKWALGYQQCRYSYYPDTEVLHTAARFRDKGIPADVIVLDIHYMEQYKLFTWDHERFPSPEAMINRLKEMGFQVVVMCDPGIKREQGYPTYEDGIEADVFLKYPDGTPYEGEVWPGWCHFPDFTSADTREWWAEQLSAYTKMGIAGFWNDMNEISTWGNSLPELIEFDFDGAGASTRQARNVYGLLMAKSTLEGAQLHLKGQRPFNLTRSGFAGIQKYAAVWTGDNTASDEHMLLGIRMLNSMALSGVSFAGFDAGGFIGNASETLFARWISIAAFTPFFRGHTNVNNKTSETWTFGEHTEQIAKKNISLT